MWKKCTGYKLRWEAITHHGELLLGIWGVEKGHGACPSLSEFVIIEYKVLTRSKCLQQRVLAPSTVESSLAQPLNGLDKPVLHRRAPMTVHYRPHTRGAGRQGGGDDEPVLAGAISRRNRGAVPQHSCRRVFRYRWESKRKQRS